jgi:7-alpha-hydroxysteroid dehydrogenase
MSDERFHLDDRVAIITGAGKGIGAAIATTFADAGAEVVLTARTESDLEGVAVQVRSLGRRAVVVPGDVNDLGFLASLVDRAVGELGRLDVVVNNAGGSISRPLLKTTVEQLEESFHFNVSVPFELTKLAVPHLLQQEGASVVNIGSTIGNRAVRGNLTHSLTKSAEGQLTRLMATELAPRIRVNAVLPGAIETDALAWWLNRQGDDVREQMVQRTLMRRNGTPQDIADAVLFFASPAAEWITGKLLEVDGASAEDLLPSTQPDLEPEPT